MNPLTKWITSRLGEPPSRCALEAHQLALLRETFACAQASRHYSERLRGCELAGGTPLEALQILPFSYPQELRAEPQAFLCASPSEVERIVTLPTSGTTGNPKRVFFAERELQLTADFFEFGMQNITRPRERTMVFMRGGSPDGSAVPGGVCDLLARALPCFGAEAIAYGEVSDPDHARAALISSGASCAVGIASQMLEIARFPGAQPQLRTVLLSADNTPRDAVEELSKRWNCEVFRHYGMTETAFGGAVDCSGGSGMHIREPDMIFEIIDLATGEQLPDGARGEIVLTTLTRRVMPLIRYRTGDFSRILTEPCECGCILRRLDEVQGHK